MNLIKYSGFFLVGTGVIHNLIGFIEGWPIIVDMHHSGWLDSTMLNNQILFDRAAILWFILCGTFWIVLGLTLQKALSEGFIPPRSLGLSFIILGIAIAIIVPVSGAYLFIVQGALLIYGNRSEQHK
jgi:hypothetical protein